MIFVTVGTHEQPVNWLIQQIDELKKDGTIQDDVIIQMGFSTYEPKLPVEQVNSIPADGKKCGGCPYCDYSRLG